jgi:hypothetical protein
MRPYVIALLLAAIVGLFIDMYLNQRRHKAILISLAIVLVPLAAFETAWSLTENKLNTAIREYTGNPEVSVHCQRFTEALGDVSPYKGYVKYNSDYTPTTVAQLDEDICRNLRSWIWGDKANPTIDQINAVHILTHEAQHLKGQINEAIAECDAIQADSAVAQLLGATSEQGQALADRYYRETYPRMPARYSDSGCRQYGSLDRSSADGIWP